MYCLGMTEINRDLVTEEVGLPPRLTQTPTSVKFSVVVKTMYVEKLRCLIICNVTHFFISSRGRPKILRDRSVS